MGCRETMQPKIAAEMRSFTARVLPQGSALPYWAESALKQHSEYAAADWCAARGLAGMGLAGLGAPPASSITATLPSVTAAEDLFNGDPKGLVNVVLSTVLRAGLIGVGLYIAGERKKLVSYSVMGAAMIEAFVLLYIKGQMGENSIPGLRRAQIKLVNDAIGWKGSDGYDQYLGLSRRGLGAFLPSDFNDQSAVDAWVVKKVEQAAIESGISPGDVSFQQSATPFVQNVVLQLKAAAAKTCADRASLCARLEA